MEHTDPTVHVGIIVGFHRFWSQYSHQPLMLMIMTMSHLRLLWYSDALCPFVRSIDINNHAAVCFFFRTSVCSSCCCSALQCAKHQAGDERRQPADYHKHHTSLSHTKPPLNTRTTAAQKTTNQVVHQTKQNAALLPHTHPSKLRALPTGASTASTAPRPRKTRPS